MRIGSAYNPNPRDPLTIRYARTLDEMKRDPYAWHEGSDDSTRPSTFSDSHFIRGAPSGFDADLQRALLTPPKTGLFRSMARAILSRFSASARHPTEK
jgi:hypothetical protein